MTLKSVPPPASPTVPPPLPQPRAACLDAEGVLARARVLLFRLQADPATASSIDRQAAASVTRHRHGEQGRQFTAKVIKAVGAGAGEGMVDMVIREALLKAEINRKGLR